MGIEALVGLMGAGISAASNAHIASAQAQAQAELSQKTMNFNKAEAAKARKFSADQANIDRAFNKAEAAAARSFTAAQAKYMMDFNAAEAVKARSFNAQESLLARQFEERMSSTAHQREVQDLRAAGLNPVLSATGGNGASSPVAPILASPMASGTLGSSAQASHSGSGTAAASVSGLQALKKGSFLGNFMSSALDLVKAQAELKRADASDKEADASIKRAETDAKRASQEIEESISRVGLNHDQHEINEFVKLSEEERVRLVREQIETEVLRRSDQHELSQAQKEACLISARAYAGLASAEAALSNIRGKLESERNPAVINELQKQAKHYESEIKKNDWIMSNPEEINRRAFHEANPSNAGTEFFSKVIGNIVHGSISISNHSSTIKKSR